MPKQYIYFRIPTYEREDDMMSWVGIRKFLLLVSVLLSSAFYSMAAETAQISGTITGPDGITPLADIRVTLHVEGQWQWTSDNTTLTDSNGYYSFNGLEGNTYNLQFEDFTGHYAPSAYSNASVISDATPITVPAGSHVQNINASLTTGASISGTVTGPLGVPVEDIYVTAQKLNNPNSNPFFIQQYEIALTDVTGHYTVKTLTPGTYSVSFYDETGTYCSEEYDDIVNGPYSAIKTPVFLNANTELNGIDASLSPAGSISGKVTGLDGVTPMNEVWVTAYRWNGLSWFRYDWPIWTINDGTYTLTRLEAGIYRVTFSLGRDNYTRTYPDAPDFNDGQDIALSAGGTVNNINACLPGSTGSISGQVTDGAIPLEGIMVTLSASNSWQRYASDLRQIEYNPSQHQPLLTDTNGCYTIDGLPEGDYFLRFHDPSGQYAGQQYSKLGIDAVIIPAGGRAVSNINVALSRPSAIEGTVTYNGTPVEGISITLCQWNDPSEDVYGSASSSSNGTYRLEGLQAGTYALRYGSWFSGYAYMIYDQSIRHDAGIPIQVGTEETVQNIDLVLAKSGVITGTITSADRNQPIPDVVVAIYNESAAGWQQVNWARSGTNGTYAIEWLAPGTYHVEVNPLPGGDCRYESKVYPNASDLDSGADIVLEESGTTVGIDVALPMTQYEPPRIMQFQEIGSSTLSLSYAGITDQVYTPQVSTNLNAHWIDCGLPAICREGTNSFTVSECPSPAIWRLRQLKQ